MSVPAPCSILTNGIFTSLAPSPTDPPYSYAGLCTAITDWNAGNPSNQIFVGATELERRNELAAFLGHTLHESGNYVYPREISPCGTTANADGSIPWSSGTVYCQPSGYSPGQGAYTDPYCSTAHTPTSNPDGCDCSPVAEVIGAGYDADELFFGRGPIQLSWNYNYIDAGNALGVDLCNEPDLVATDAAISWGTAIWFWMENTGAVGVTPHAGVTTQGSFGESLNTINGGLECSDDPSVTSHNPSIVTRLEKYCGASKSLGVSLLSLDGCTDLQSIFDSCISTGSGEWGRCPSCDGSFTASPTASPTTTPTSSPTTPPTASTTTSPTKTPTSSPTTSPTTSSPTTNPTTTPTMSPTTSSPTTSPTKTPTSSPTTSPTTSVPTTSPTNAPTLSPTTSSPTTSPTNAPTLSPTTSPTTNSPTISPTKAPTMSPTTSSPTTSPTKLPTSSPTTAAPTSSPTTPEPTSSPTTAAPSSPPTTSSPTTTAPTPLPTTRSPTTPSAHPWYPDWDGSNDGCVADGNESPWTPAYSDQSTCCQAHYGWNLNACMGSPNAPTGKYFPDWAVTGTCKLDEGDAPTYMRNNPIGWLTETLAECCTAHFGWNHAVCAGGPSDVAGLWYPNWEGGTNECLNDDKQPAYMTNNPSIFMHSSRESCCDDNYSWAPETCLGTQ